MSSDLSVRDLFDAFHEKLDLHWVAGEAGSTRIIENTEASESATPLIGYLNFIHPHRVQMLGQKELEYLESLKKNSRKDAITQLCSGASDMIVVAGSDSVPDDLRERSESKNIPLLRSSLPSRELTKHIQYFLNSRLTQKTTLHGVFMEVMGMGVLITGDPSIGKSELALELVSRGHRLIADDAPEFSAVGPDIISGSCPEVLQDFLEVRGLGVLNVRAMFGDSSIKPNKYLRLIVYLQHMSDEQLNKIDRLRGSHRDRTLLGVQIPEITLPVAPGRNLAVMIEAAARNHILKLKGYDASRVFEKRQQKHIEKSSQ